MNPSTFCASLLLAATIPTSVLAADGEASGNTGAPTASPQEPTVVLKKDDHGRVIQKTIGDDPNNQKIWQYAYDEKGLLTTEMDPDGIVTLYAYDADGRITERRQQGANPHKTVVTYNDLGHIETVTVDGVAVELAETPSWKDHRLYIGDQPVY
jgi:YD repeat-containing protein